MGKGGISITKSDVKNFVIKAVFNFFSELIATATLVFLGCMSTVMGLGQPGDLTGIALSFAFAIVAAVEVGIHLSGGHVNPILTIAAVVFKKVSIPMSFVYMFGQICGSTVGYGLVVALNPKSHTNVMEKAGACVTMPNANISVVQALFSEFITSSILVLVFCSQIDPRNVAVDTISIKVGLTVFTCAYAAAVYSGCSMNPARSLGPAIWNNTWDSHWIYWVGPISASIIWSLIYYKIFIELWPKNKESEE